IPVTRSVRALADRTSGSLTMFPSGADTRGSGPLIRGSGSRSATARVRSPEGIRSLRDCRILESCTAGCRPARGGDWRAKTPTAHTSTRESANPSAAPPSPSRVSEVGLERRSLIEPPTVLATTSPSTAKARMLPSVMPAPYRGFPSSGMREGAILDPTEAPTTTPTSEKTPARKPVLAPRSTVTTTKSAMKTSRTLRPANSIDRFYRRCKLLTAYNLLTMNAAEFLPDVQAVLEQRNEPSYRMRQIYGALTGSLVRDWEEATSLPQGLRATLNEEAPAAVLDLRRTWRASDGTRKYLFYTHDAHAIETVVIPEKGRHTVCISTQVGCPMACKFCATGLLGIKRNLKMREIAEQVFVAARDIAPERVSNVVVMGMGEPFLNYEQTLSALKTLNDPDGFARAARHIAASTSGLVDRIRRFADEPEQFHLAISLHNPFEDERRDLMPVAARHPIPELMGAARYYVQRTRRKLFFEYTLLAGVNDQPRHVEALGPLRDPAAEQG